MSSLPAIYPPTRSQPKAHTTPKDPADVVRYGMDFGKELAELGETVQSFTVTAEAGLTVSLPQELNGLVSAVMSDGDAGRDYVVTYQVVTTNAYVIEASGVVRVRNR